MIVSGGKGRFEDCDIWGGDCGFYVVGWGDPTIVGCTIHDHAKLRGEELEGSGCGVYVAFDAVGGVEVGADCVFARNAGGDVVGRTR